MSERVLTACTEHGHLATRRAGVECPDCGEPFVPHRMQPVTYYADHLYVEEAEARVRELEAQLAMADAAVEEAGKLVAQFRSQRDELRASELEATPDLRQET